MCQMRIIMQQDDHEEVLLEDAVSLNVTDDAIVVAALLEEPLQIREAAIDSIDFLANTLILKRIGKEPACSPPQRSTN